MNQYPLWKYILLIVVASMGAFYAMPNIYPPDPAIQVSGASAAQDMDQKVLDKATAAMKAAGLDYFGEKFSEKSVLIRLLSLDDQMQAQRVVQTALDKDFEGGYVVAVNQASTTPDWLTNLGAYPMKLGLDLAGGVHFLLEVDTKLMMRDEITTIRKEVARSLRKERLKGANVRLEGLRLEIAVKSDDERVKVTTLLRANYSNLEYNKFEKDGRYIVDAGFTEAYVREREDYAIAQNLTTLRKRVNEIGVSEPIVQRQGRNRIVVQLPGIQDTARAKAIIGKTASLEFRIEAKPGARASEKDLFPFKDERQQQLYGGAYLERRAIVYGKNVTNAQVNFDQDTNQPQVSITLDGRGGDLMNKKTRRHVNEKMGVLFIEYKTRTHISTDENGHEVKTFEQIPSRKIISLSRILEPLGHKFRVTGLDSYEEAAEFALLLRAGALAAPMGFVEERTIGPSLGKENVEVGVRSVQLGLILVVLFMLFYYRVFGFAANIALTLNLVLLMAIMSGLGATLTLPGIAGIVLTVGMAVDANVLIFSRIKEELADGAPNQTAISSGFDRAFVTILDANVTTLIVALILYAVGSGPVQGFAVTLAIGILTSMFTAIVGTRAVVNLIYGNRKVEKLWI
ncbi:MAG: protein translocase subunit SecD [Alteromonadaceae bacterium]|nr:MAG: protein translocase subunit SecD [Alteromonadaceae bacterium]